ncbi:MAG: hypothetical protein A4E63_02145 [Syntrophorhabdus sp. PtaU1.Bin050]|jgi:predicted RNA-binding Zn-ribbon protein involved in translation (DUF1610 family)|nr:MAG: hypothetical protein A4E63_02145 [Syntrophorhabdus sp. PtaU1.Bin050]
MDVTVVIKRSGGSSDKSPQEYEPYQRERRAVEAMECPQCSSEMFEEYDYVNRVKVLVCPKPTCLHRIYPDYPRRKGNEEICYVCRQVFRVRHNDSSVLCPECREKAWRNKNTKGSGDHEAETGKTLKPGWDYTANPKPKIRRAV